MVFYVKSLFFSFILIYIIENMLSRYKKRFLYLAGVVCLFALGLFFGLYSWNQNLYVTWSPSSQRGLAEDSQTQVLVNVPAEQIVRRADKALFENIRLIEGDDLLTFYLGNILIPNKEDGRYLFLCEAYSHIEFSFSPVGIKLSGDPGLMLLQSPCRQEEEFELGPFFISKNKILASPEKRAFEFEETNDYISFYKASVVLTPSWILKTIRFFNPGQEENQEFIVRYNPENNDPFELTLKEEDTPPELLLKQRSF